MYNLLIKEYQEEKGTKYVPYTSVSEGWVDMLYDQNGSYVCQRNNYDGTTTCTAEGEFVQVVESFKMTYEIEWDKANLGVTATVLDGWTHEKKPTMIGTFIVNFPYDDAKGRMENQTPTDSWYLFFGTSQDAKSRIKISAWKAKSLEEQAAYLGEAEKDPDLNEDPAKEAAADPSTQTALQKLFGSNNPNSKINWLWVVLATVITATVGVAVWGYRRYRRTKRKAQMAAMKYGKYSRDVVDVLT